MPAGEDVTLYRLFLSTFIGSMFARCSSRIEDLQVDISTPNLTIACANDSLHEVLLLACGSFGRQP
jgi:hypothetical protein